MLSRRREPTRVEPMGVYQSRQLTTTGKPGRRRDCDVGQSWRSATPRCRCSPGSVIGRSQGWRRLRQRRGRCDRSHVKATDPIPHHQLRSAAAASHQTFMIARDERRWARRGHVGRSKGARSRSATWIAEGDRVTVPITRPADALQASDVRVTMRSRVALSFGQEGGTG